MTLINGYERSYEADTCRRCPFLISTPSYSYENQEIALNCGMILRECVRHESLARSVLESPHFWKLFNYVELSTFDVASDAFATFKVCLSLIIPACLSSPLTHAGSAHET